MGCASRECCIFGGKWRRVLLFSMCNTSGEATLPVHEMVLGLRFEAMCVLGRPDKGAF